MEFVAQYSFAIKVFLVLFLIMAMNTFKIRLVLAWFLILSVNLLATILFILIPHSRMSRRLWKALSIVGSGHWVSNTNVNPFEFKPRDVTSSVIKADAYVLEMSPVMKIRVCTNNGLEYLIAIDISDDNPSVDMNVALAKDNEKDFISKDGIRVGLYHGHSELKQVIDIDSYLQMKESIISGETGPDFRSISVANVKTGKVKSWNIPDEPTDEQTEQIIKEVIEFTDGSEEFDEAAQKAMRNLIKHGDDSSEGVRTFTFDNIPGGVPTKEERIKAMQSDEDVAEDTQKILEEFKKQRKINFGKVQDLRKDKGNE